MFWFFRRRRIRKQLEKYVSPEVAQAILDDPHELEATPRFEEKELEWLLVMVELGTIEEFLKRVETVCDLAIEHDGAIFSLSGSLAQIAVAEFAEMRPPERRERRLKLVAKLRERLGVGVKIVHGSSRAVLGPVGSKSRFSYTFLIPNFAEALRTLAEAPFGEDREVATVELGK